MSADYFKVVHIRIFINILWWEQDKRALFYSCKFLLFMCWNMPIVVAHHGKIPYLLLSLLQCITWFKYPGKIFQPAPLWLLIGSLERSQYANAKMWICKDILQPSFSSFLRKPLADDSIPPILIPYQTFDHTQSDLYAAHSSNSIFQYSSWDNEGADFPPPSYVQFEELDIWGWEMKSAILLFFFMLQNLGISQWQWATVGERLATVLPFQRMLLYSAHYRTGTDCFVISDLYLLFDYWCGKYDYNDSHLVLQEK